MNKNLKIFVAGYDVMGRNMAGPGIRSLAIVSYLSRYSKVTLSCDNVSEITDPPDGVEIIPETDIPWSDEKYWKKFDAAVMPGTQMLKSPLPMPFPIPLYVDIYDPFILENIELLSDKNPEIRDYEYTRHLKALIEMLMRGDRFIVTGERAVDFFTGMLSAWGVVNPLTASKNKFEKLFLTIPFGIPDESFKDAFKNSDKKLPDFIHENDELIIWAGGLWDWLDPRAAVEAMPAIIEKRPSAKLMFPGYKHPNKHIPLMQTTKECIETARKLKLLDRSIFFIEWTPYAERIAILARANLGLSLHKKHIETKYAFRTRIMDYIWAGIPMVISGGDNLASDLSDCGASILEPGAASSDVANAVISMLEKYSDKNRRFDLSKSYDYLRVKYRWSEVLKPLWESLQKPEKIKGEFYTKAFYKLLEHFPEAPKPGIIAKGIDKIKRKL